MLPKERINKNRNNQAIFKIKKKERKRWRRPNKKVYVDRTENPKKKYANCSH
jgi:hypothetical protein